MFSFFCEIVQAALIQLGHLESTVGLHPTHRLAHRGVTCADCINCFISIGYAGVRSGECRRMGAKTDRNSTLTAPSQHHSNKPAYPVVTL